MPDQINQIDADQNREIALLKQKIEDAERDFHDLRDRVRLLEKWVWGAAAVVGAIIIIAGLVANAQEVEDGSHDATKQEVLLQLSSN